ncbi:U6 snRNA-associated Sm-like protein LSm2 isoform 1 [Mus musculus]|uniref:U6 snRNA-associated Sm-like protein LSm2 n=2 Tax=Mus TaxID=862507 RepID=O35901_MOUSE|nr:U6 snRNA-associated Sm-like protein LSm2 isoform 1 [Mus musculus]AAB72038.1 snRNP core Sm protein homolog Sm-X5 [Mus musculus]AAC84150.1 smRNP [Mus musculus]AAC84171.1 smRNP [Mus musculus]AAG31423.1 snRNP core protein SMX5 [Mus musculus]AAG31424.1 snRNP core protein SMX5 [Mus musculus]|eukprot:NP_085100.1 U6 snRNA-associated Sm-like protein LSm2 isoform 1 [Mus musculus]
MVFWGKPLASPRESPRAPGENGKRALHFCAVDEDFVRLFYSFFKSLVGKDVVVELKNDLSICGTLHSVDQYLNIKLTDISVTDPEKYPHMLSVKNCFIRGSVVRYVQLPADEVDTQLLQDAARKEALQQKQ